MNNSDGAFLAGFVFAVIILTAFFVNTDNDFISSEFTHKKIIKLCAAHNSTPLSYDMCEVTCSNGLTLNYTSIELPKDKDDG